MNKYVYEGPVLEFGRVVCDRWKAETLAASESKARSNFIFQFKQANNKAQATKIVLTGKIKLITGKDAFTHGRLQA